MVLKTNTSIGSRNAETRDQLIDAAIICLAEVGYAGATMRRIADTAGVTQGPRQYYFPTPVRMFEAVVDRIHSSEGEFVEEMRINFSNATFASAHRGLGVAIAAGSDPKER